MISETVVGIVGCSLGVLNETGRGNSAGRVLAGAGEAKLGVEGGVTGVERFSVRAAIFSDTGGEGGGITYIEE